jgi:hypothetical protein
MKISRLLWILFKALFKYGNCEIDLLIETDKCQTEAKLGEVAIATRTSGKNRVKLLSEGFT